MSKLVFFNIVSGDFQNGFTVALQIRSEDDNRWLAEEKGKLPSAPELPQSYIAWRNSYRKIVLGRSPTRIQTSIRTDTDLIKDIRKTKKKLQDNINQWLTPQADFFPIWEELLRNLTDRQEIIRVVVKTDVKDLQYLPLFLWDKFFSDYHRSEIGLFIPVNRQQVENTRNKVKVLAIFGNKGVVGSETQIDTDKDWKMLTNLLSEESNAELIRLDKPSLEKLSEAIDEYKPQILFFAGHSKSEEDEVIGFIELNKEELITIEDLENDLIKAVKNGLELAIFNSCDGVGIAKQLSQYKIPNIIIMREPVPDEVAQKFLQRFLEAFAAGKPLSLAVRRAREKLTRLENKFPGSSWLPMLWSNPSEPPLTWKSLGGVETNRQLDSQDSKKGQPDSIL